MQRFKKFSEAQVTQPLRKTMTLPAFTLATPTWLGASQRLSEYAVGNTDYYFSFKTPIRKFGINFIPAIRWKLDNKLYRFKLWDDSLAVLYFPVYSGEKIGLNAVMEIWSINTVAAPSLSAAKVFSSSVLVFPAPGCGCTVTPENINLTAQTPIELPPYAHCNPFCDLAVKVFGIDGTNDVFSDDSGDNLLAIT